MKNKQLYKTPEVKTVPLSVEEDVCTVSNFQGFGNEDDWDNEE